MPDRFPSGSRYAELDTSAKFGAWLRARLKEYGVSVTTVAADIGVAPGTVYNWLKGRLPRLPRDGEPDRFEDGLLSHPGLALSSSQREHLAERRRVLIGAAVVAFAAEPAWRQRDLPADIGTFTGRHVQLDQLNRLLVRKERVGTVVISALSGMGGVGKTALAVRWAYTPEVRRTFPDGAVYVNLNGFAETEPLSASEAQARLLRQLGVKPQAIPLEAEAVAGLYHDTLAGRGLLLVLDNARDEPQVRPLLPKDSGCLAMVTSRNRLTGLAVSHDAACLNLDALTPRESARLLRQLLGGAADREPEAVDALAVACAHLPLALRIAAASFLTGPGGVSLGEYVAELTDDRLAKLAVGATDPATAIKTVLDRSYRNLTTGAQRALRLLSAHPGTDWDSYAAASLLDADLDATEALLGELCEHSLVDLADDRYQMHDLTAEHAREHPDTEPAQREAALGRLWNYYRRAARLAADQYEPQENRLSTSAGSEPVPDFQDLLRATQWLDAERANLLSAVTSCAERGDSAVVGDLAGSLFRYLELSGHWRDGITVYTLECEHATLAEKCRALNRLAVMRGRLESPVVARELYEQALELARQTGNTRSEIRILNNLGVMSDKLGRLEDAVSHYRQSIVVARSVRDNVSLGRGLNNIGVVHMRRGEYDLATEYCQQALSVARDRGIPSTEAFALNNLGTIFEAEGNQAAAVDYFHQGLELSRRIGIKIIEWSCLSGLGDVSEQNGQFEDALAFQVEALLLTEQLDDQSGKAKVLNRLSAMFQRLERFDEASRRAREALTLATEMDSPYEQARAHDNIAHCLATQDDTDAARRHWTEALRIFTDLGMPEAREVRDALAELPGDSAAVTPG